MKIKALIIALFFCIEALAQVQGFIEQIYYVDADGQFSIGPIAGIQNSRNWYAEARYNYEEKRTVSLYVGKVFSHEGKLSYSVLPILGGVVGRYKGASAGLNIDVEYKRFFFMSHSQYTFSAESETDNFFFSWSELGYYPLKWLCVGLAMQPTFYPNITDYNALSPGFMVGFSFGKWSFPLYVFNPFDENRAFACSIIKSWGKDN